MASSFTGMECQESQMTAPQPTATDPPRTVRTELVEGSGSTESTSMPDNLRTVLETFHEKTRVKRKPECSRNRYQPRKSKWKMFDRDGEDVGIAQFKVIIITKSWQLTYYAWVVYPKSEPPKLVITTKFGSHRTYYLEWFGHDAGFEERYCAVRIWKKKDKEIPFDPDFWESVPAFFTPSEQRVALLSEGDSDSDTSMDVDEHVPHSSPPYGLRSKRRSLVAASDSDDDTECERSGPVTCSSRKRPVEPHDSLIVPLRGPKIARLVRHFHISERRDGIEQLDNGNGHECHLVEDSIDKLCSPKPDADGRSDEQDEQESERTDCSSDAGVPQDDEPETQGTGIQEKMAQDDDGMEVCETGGSGSDESDSEGESDSYESSSEESDDSSSEGESSDEEVEEPTNGISGTVAKAVGNNKNNENDGNNEVNEINGPATPTSTGNAAHPSDSPSAMRTRRERLAERPNSRDHTTRASKAARTSGPSNVQGSGDGNRRHTNGDAHGQNLHQIPVKTENGSDQSSSGETDSEESSVGESDTDSNDPEEGLPLESAPTRNARTVNRRVIFCFIGHPDDSELEMGFTPRWQQPGAELFEKAKGYFRTQPDVLYFADFEKRRYAFSKECLEDVDRRVNLWEISATNIIGGGQVFIGRDLKLLKRKA